MKPWFTPTRLDRLAWWRRTAILVGSLLCFAGNPQAQEAFEGIDATPARPGQEDTIRTGAGPAAGAGAPASLRIGYGTREPGRSTHAVSGLDEDSFNAGNVTNAWHLVQGRAPGLIVSRPGSNPNALPQVRLRSLTTILGRSSPLLVVDGVVGADLLSVDPADIARIDLLRDGSAAAMYGGRAASGVVRITTKEGAAGPARVFYRAYLTAERVANTPAVLEADRFRRLGENLIEDFGHSTSWFEEIARTAISHTHHLAFSGGKGGFAYRAALNLRDNQGVILNTGFRQVNGRLNLRQKALKDRLTLDLLFTASDREEQLGFDRVFRYATIYNPTAPVRVPGDPAFSPYGGYFQQVQFDYYNPVAMLEQNRNEARRDLLLGSLRGAFELAPGVELATQYALERSHRTRGQYFSKNSFFVGAERDGLAELSNEESELRYFLATLHAARTLGTVLDLDVLAGYEWQSLAGEGFGMSGGDFITDAFSYHNMGASLDFPNGRGQPFSYKATYRNIAFFARAQVDLQDRYFLNASLRREGNSRFGDQSQWAWYPAISGGVRLEKWLAWPGLDLLKLRAGWSRTGQIPPENHLSRQLFSPGQPVLVDGAWIPGYEPVSAANPGLGAERTNEISVGLDFALLDNRLIGSLDYYRRRSQDLIFPIQAPVPPNLSWNKHANVGELTGGGIEWSLGWRAVEEPRFAWTTGLLGATFRQTRLEKLSNEEFDFDGPRYTGNLGAPGCCGVPLFRIGEGEPIGQIWALEYLGVGENGNWRFADRNGDGVVSPIRDGYVAGNGLPRAQLSWTNHLTLGSFDVTLVLDGLFGHDLINSFRAFYEAKQVLTAYNVLETAFEGDLAQLEDFPRFSDLQVERASFVRLNNLDIGYTFAFDSDRSFSRIRVFLTGERLFYLTGYQGVDPGARLEDGSSRDRVFTPGIDRRDAWFRSAALSFGGHFAF